VVVVVVGDVVVVVDTLLILEWLRVREVCIYNHERTSKVGQPVLGIPEPSCFAL
jgi:hypothetical protein